MQLTVSVDTIYDLRLAQSNKKKRKKSARDAPIFARVCMCILGLALAGIDAVKHAYHCVS